MIVLRDLPEHDAAQVMRLDEGCLVGDGVRVVAGDETVRGRVPQIRCVGFRIPIAHVALLVDERVFQHRPRIRPDEMRIRLLAATVDGAHTIEAQSVERHADDDLAGGNAGGKILTHDTYRGARIRGRRCRRTQTGVMTGQWRQ